MNDKINIIVSELIEYSQLMDRLTFQNHEEESEIYVEIKNRTQRHVSGLLQGDMTYFVKNLFISLLIRDFAEFRCITTVNEFFNIIDTMSEEELLDSYYMALVERHPWEDAKIIQEEIEDDDYLSVSGFKYTDFQEFVQNFSALKDRLIDFLHRFYSQVFLPEKDYIMEQIEKATSEFELMFKDNERLVIQALFKVNKEYYLKASDYRANIYISVCSPIITTYTLGKDKPEMQHIILGNLIINQVMEQENELLVRYLVEHTKLQIIKMLIKRPMYASEIAAQLDLKRTTVAHHLHQLGRTGAVDNAYAKGNKVFYKANIERIETGFQQFIEQLKSEVEINE